MVATSPESQMLHDIREQEGREPTIAEADEASRARQLRGGVSLANVTLQGDYTPGISEWGESVLEQIQQPLFAQGEKEPLFRYVPAPKTTGWDLESALIEVGLEGRPWEFDARVKENTEKRHNLKAPYINKVGNEVLASFRDMQTRGKFSKDVMLLSDEEFEDLNSPEKKSKYLQELMTMTDMRDAQQRLFLGMELVSRYGTELSPVILDELQENLPLEHKEALMESMLQESKDALTREVKNIVTQQNWDNDIEAVTDIALQDFLPVANVATKMWFLSVLMDTMGVPAEQRPTTRNIGDSRAALRQWAHELGPARMVEELKLVRKRIEELQDDPVMGNIVREYLVLEQFENVFTPELIQNDDPLDNFDKWAGRVETGIEVVLLGWLAKSGGKSLSKAFRSVNTSVLNNTARNTGARAAQTEMDRVVQGALAEQMGIDPGEAALNLMPRPSQLVDERTIKLPGVEDTVHRSEAIVSEILQASRTSLKEVFLDSEKQAIANAEMAKLQLGDHARVAPAMSTMEVLDDGILINSVISKNGEEAYKNFDELLTDLVALDPELENLTVLRRGSKGTLEPVTLKGGDEVLRIATNQPKGLSDKDLAIKLADANKNGREMEALQLEREMTRRSGETSVSQILDDEYFLQWNHFRAFHPVDKVAFGADTIRHTAIPLDLLAPNMKFGNDLWGAVQASTNLEARTLRLYNDLYSPYYNLPSASKRRVDQVFAWAEDEAQAIGRDLDLYELRAQFPDLTPKELQGIVAYRVGQDAQHHVLDRRMWLDANGRGHKTARPLTGDLPAYHGRVLEPEEITQGVVYDPVTQAMRKLTKNDVDSIAAGNGNIMKLDVPIEVPGSNGLQKSSKILLEPNAYRVGKLSENILPKYPGYRYRFYEDPYLIVKVQDGVSIDGKISTIPTETAFRTAGSRLESEQFLSRAFTKVDGADEWVDKSGTRYKIERTQDIAQTDAALKQKQALQWEGRLFMDQRQQKALLNVNGNQSELMDFTRALERGTSLTTRMNTHEDMLRSLRNAVAGTFKLPELEPVKIKNRDIRDILKDLKDGRKNAVGTELEKTYAEAISVIKYIRSIEGVDSPATEYMRAQVMKQAIWADRLANQKGYKPGKFGSVEKYALNADPLRAMRSTAFGTFMVARPGRQAVLQMMQPLFLAGIDPVYVLSGKGMSDSILLRTAFKQLRDKNYIADGMSIKGRAKLMGLSEKELKTLVTKLDKSGTIDVVDIHSFSGGTRRWNQLEPHTGAVGSKAIYGAKRGASMLFNRLKEWGFDMGEEMNKLGTFNVAYRSVMKKNGYKSLLELTDGDWRQVYRDVEHLSFAMTKAGAFGYQSGLASIPTQFISFTHKNLLTLMGQNPALKGKDLAKIWAGMFALYGADMAGLQTQTREFLYGIGFDDSTVNAELPGGGTVLELLSAGSIQTFVNMVGNVTTDDWKDLSVNTIGPTMNAYQFVELFLEGITQRPIGTMFGPFGNRFSAFLQAAEFTNLMLEGFDGNIVDKAAIMADLAAKKLLPQYNDATLAYLHWKHGILLTSNGTAQQIDPSLFSVFLRGTVGMRTLEEEADFRRRELQWDHDAMKKDAIASGRRAVLQYINLYRTNEIDADLFMDLARMVGHISQMFPEHVREEIIQGIMLPHVGTDDLSEAPSAKLAEAVIEKMSLSAGQAKAVMSQIPMEDEQRTTLNKWIDEKYDERSMNQAEMAERMIKRNEK